MSATATPTAAVRRARPSDVAWLLGELRAFAATYPLERVSLFPADEADVAELLGQIMAEGVLLVADHEVLAVPLATMRADRFTVLDGLIGGYWHPHPYNGALHVLTETFWWTTPSARRAGVGQHLLDAFVAEGRAGGADVISLTVLPDRTPPGVEASLIARGFAEAERVYVLEMQNAPAVTGAPAGLENKECDAGKLAPSDPSDASAPAQAALTYRVDWR